MNDNVIDSEICFGAKKVNTRKALKFMWHFFLFTALLVVVCVAFSLLSDSGFKRVENVQNSIISNIDIERNAPLPVLIIDAGHGGIDGGAVSADGQLEKDINLGIAKHLSALLTLRGFEVVMTRENDSDVVPEGHTGSRKRGDLLGRVSIAEKYENALFISIHQNKFPIEKYNGLQVYYSKNNDESKSLAESVKNINIRLLQKDNKRECKSAGSAILVLNKLKIPAVLVECGFLSNQNEARLLSDDCYRRKLAFVLFCAVCDYVDNR